MGEKKTTVFFYSKLDNAIAEISKLEMEQQVRILKAQAIVSSPTHRSVELKRELSPDVMKYLRNKYEYTDQDIAQLIDANGLLTD